MMAAGFWLIPSLTQAKPKVDPSQDTENQRDGYSRSFVVDDKSVVIVVPEGKRYVLMRMYSRIQDHESPWAWGESYWNLMVDGEMFLEEFSLHDPNKGAGTGAEVGNATREDFPDGYVVVEGGQTLEIVKHEDVEYLFMTLIGYLCDAP
jgi:hypothetical protein